MKEKLKEKTENSLRVDHREMTGKIKYRLTNDYLFRAVMQKNKNVLKHLVCALLDLPIKDVVDLEIQNPIELGKEIDSKTCVLDIKVLLNNNQYINIEMQTAKQSYWKERSLTYLCRMYDNLESGQEYDEVIPVIQISILDFDLFENIEELVSKYYLTNDNPKYRNHYVDNFSLYVLNLKQVHNEKIIREQGNTELYQWAKLFQAESWEEIRMLAEQNEVIDECACAMKQLTEDEKIRMQCEARKDYIAREKGLISRVTRQVTQEVTEKVTEQVTQQVTQQVTLDLARNLLDTLDIKTIAEKTGLSVEQVKTLSKE